MKVRTGFVSNSSSSSFFFCVKGEENNTVEMIKKRVCDMILKHRDRFSCSTSYTDYNCNALDVVRCVESNVKGRAKKGVSDSFHDNYHCVLSLDELIADWEKQLLWSVSSLRHSLIKRKLGKKVDSWENEWDNRSIKGAIKMLERLRRIKRNEQTSLVKLEFGDSHGITGPVGCSMDGDFQPFEADDLSVVKVCNH